MIRTAVLDDIPELTKIAKSFYVDGEFAEKGLNFKEMSFIMMAQSMIVDSANKLILVAEHEGQIVGMLGAYVSPWFCDFSQFQVVESWFYVLPEYRKFGYGKELLNVLTEIAQKSGAVNLKMASLHNEKQNIMGRFYRSQGFVKSDSFYVKELNHG